MAMFSRKMVDADTTLSVQVVAVQKMSIESRKTLKFAATLAINGSLFLLEAGKVQVRYVLRIATTVPSCSVHGAHVAR